ncbi:hypothetical protein [Pontibacter sp. G13]|uniref:hypothetical protein n=1 Tax=Pontibacter sp. G13 TaxID=3074898 RepID=UPI00288BA6C9|nr:hypothetical protein [Pontibacter sp. G13]WNJ17630.1 hypothetical protein RJD25_22495 [Pontibacter sp. G13]
MRAFILSMIMIGGSLLSVWGQTSDYGLKKPVSELEIQLIQGMFQRILETDQQCRKYAASNTLDDRILAQLDSAGEAGGLEGYIQFQESLHLELPKSVEDSLWKVQHQLDLQNHLALRGIFETYGYLPEEITGELDYLQLLVLMHPPCEWDVRTYLESYAELFRDEVKAGRMPAKTFASFYDNQLGKILREPQLYGTNEVYSRETGKIGPPVIADLAQSNAARAEIGLPPLTEGEYQLAEE